MIITEELKNKKQDIFADSIKRLWKLTEHAFEDIKFECKYYKTAMQHPTTCEVKEYYITILFAMRNIVIMKF